MKNTIRVVALALVMVIALGVLASCGNTLSGEYSAEFLGTGTTFEFKGKDVKLKVIVATIEVASVDGTYSIKDDKITFDFIDEEKVDNDKAKDILAQLNGTFDFEKGDGYIKIAGTKYTVVDKK